MGWLLFAAGATAMFVALEQLAPRTPQPIRWRAIAVATVLLGIDGAITQRTRMPASGTAARMVLAFVLVELADYALHRAMHAHPLLWRFHRLHHDEPLAWHVAWRIHPVDAALFALGTTAACWLAGAPLPTAAAFVIGRRVWSALLHANLAWPASALDHVIATPAFHRVHHEARANFASTLPGIDRLLGTYRGSRTANVAPCPGSLDTSIAPPCASTSLRTT
jgi:sterol desaturase/sphingolipid hydroxylase (fatty acid hydroxylase superfamily)